MSSVRSAVRRYKPLVRRAVYVKPIYMFITEAITASETYQGDRIIPVLENILAVDLATPQYTLTQLVTETTTLPNFFTVGFRHNLVESVTVSDVFKVVFINIVNEYLVANGLSSTQLTTLLTILESFHIVDGFLQIHPVLVTETLSAIASLLQSLKAFSSLDESLTISQTDGNFLHVSTVLTESLVNSEEWLTSANIKQYLADNMMFLPNIIYNNETYAGWVMNSEIFAVTEYTNYNFNSMCKFQGRYFGLNSGGLYEFTGSMDDQSYIQVKLETPAYDLKTSNLKQVPTMYLGIGQDNTLVIKVNVDRNNTTYYRLPVPSRELRTQYIKLGKGLIGKYFQFEIITENVTEFKLDTFEFFPIVFGRKF